MIWVINTNSNLCRIYNYHKVPAQLTLLKELKHPEARAKNSAYLTSDKPGKYIAGDSAHGSYSPHTDPKTVEIEKFSREIASELDHARKVNSFEKLIIITPPQMSGLLLNQLDKHVKERVTHKFQKDLLHLSEKELLDYLKENAKYSEG
jgi:protein required for attachment to host cells